MAKYVCTVCHLSTTRQRDCRKQALPGTRWEDLPDDFVCPLCGAEKSEFEKQEDSVRFGRKSRNRQWTPCRYAELSPLRLALFAQILLAARKAV